LAETITILSPVPEPVEVAAKFATSATSPRQVLRVSLLSNGKPNSDHLLDGVVEILGGRSNVRIAERIQKGSSSAGAGEEILRRLIDQSDVVVNATCD
jgi:hypothetical protein